MEYSPIKPTVLKWGLYTGLAGAAYGIFLYATNSTGNTMLSMLPILISVGGVFLALKEYKAINQGFMPFNTGFKTGFLTSFLAAVVSLIINQIYTTFINKDAITQVLETQRMKLEENPQMTEELIEMTMSWTEKVSTAPLSIIIGLVFGAIGAALIAVIIAAIMKNDPDA